MEKNYFENLFRSLPKTIIFLIIVFAVLVPASGNIHGSTVLTVSTSTEPNLIIKKNTTGGTGNESFHYDIFPTPSTLDVTTAGNATNATGQESIYLSPGNYTITEAIPSGWQFNSVTCDQLYTGGTADETSVTIGVVVLPELITTCTFNNSKIPVTTNTITINKVVNPSNDQGRFQLRIDGQDVGPVAGNGVASGSGAIPKPPGNTYTISEVGVQGTNLNNYDTTVSGDCAPDPNDLTKGTVFLPAGQGKTCTIINTRKVPNTITVNKL